MGYLDLYRFFIKLNFINIFINIFLNIIKIYIVNSI